MGKKESQAGSLLTGNKAHFVIMSSLLLLGAFYLLPPLGLTIELRASVFQTLIHVKCRVSCSATSLSLPLRNLLWVLSLVDDLLSVVG